MDFTAEERQSDSPLVERIWRSHNVQPGSFISVAAVHYNLVVSRYQDKLVLTVRGPEIRATPAYSPADVEFFGIQFKPGTFIPHFPPEMVIDRQDVNLPAAASQSFWLCGSAWEFPVFLTCITYHPVPPSRLTQLPPLF